MSSIVIEQDDDVTTVTGITNENLPNYLMDTVICERLEDDMYTFQCNANHIIGDGTVNKDALRIYRDAIIAMIGRE